MIHINRYIDKIASAESKQLKAMTLTMKEARDLHADITKLLLVLQTLQETNESAEPGETVQKVEISGGGW